MKTRRFQSIYCWEAEMARVSVYPREKKWSGKKLGTHTGPTEFVPRHSKK
jgi:hypothetical protein